MTDHSPASAPVAVATELAGYPQHWEADVVLVDGGVVHLRPAGAGDGAAIRAMHGRMSARTLFLRYFTPLTEVTDEQVASFTDTDYVSRVGLVAELGGEVIAAGTYHRNSTGDTAAAEVAFVVEDSQQRRGLGSILLEHLAAAARERGIRRFTAEVLSENRQMVKVFIDAGYHVNREYGSGIVDLVFNIEPTEKSRAVVTAREHRAESRSIARLLSPRSIAVIGASREPTKIGHAAMLNLLRGAFTGAVYPVHPEAGSVQGVHAYGSVLDIPEPVDLAVLAVPAARVAEVVQSCGAKGVHGLVVMTGFADDQLDGPEARRTMVSAARTAGMRIVGPSCLGVVNTDPRVRMNASLAPVVPPPGRIGFFCQSGALGVAILADAAARGLGLSTFVSAGDRADVSGNDLLQFWHGDDRTEVVLLYLESFGNPRKFARLARVLGKTKPVIAVKSGRHARTTVGLAGNRLDDAVVGTLFEQSGVIRTPGLTDAFDVAQLLSTQPVPAGNRVGIVGNSKALGVLAVDFCLDAGLQVTDDAPTDLGVTVSAEAFGAAVHRAIARPDVDALVVAWVPPVAIAGTAHAAALRDAVADASKPVVTTFLAVDGLVDHLAVRDSGGHPGRGSVPAYSTLERAVSALSHAVRYGAWLSRPAGEVPVLTGVDPSAGRAAVDGMRNAGDPERPLADAELVTLLSCYGISLLPHRIIHAVGEAVVAAGEIGYPVTLKSSDPLIRRRVDQSGVRLGLTNADQVAAAYADLTQVTGPALYVQAMAPRDHAEVSTVFGITSDPSFGALISFGIGGIATELLNDRAYRAVPLTDVDAADLISAPRAAPLLDGYRGTQPVAPEPLVDLALRLSALADDLPEVAELQLHPVLCGPTGIAVTSATGRIGPPSAQFDTRRRLS